MSLALDRHAEHFDRLYADDPDPWDYHVSGAEAFKRRAIVHALGAARRGRGLEIGCGNGASTASLAPRFASLLAVDGSAEAVALARAAAFGFRHVQVERARLPDGFPSGRFDAVVASEVLYYLPRPALDDVLSAVARALKPEGIFVAAHATRRFSDAEVSPAELRRRLIAGFGPPRRTRTGADWSLLTFAAPARCLRPCVVGAARALPPPAASLPIGPIGQAYTLGPTSPRSRYAIS